jgi:transcriptional regulator with XRE-family HTH domain
MAGFAFLSNKILTARSDVKYACPMAKSQYPIEAKTFGEKIRKKRMDLEWPLIKVANKVGISESYLARIEADKQTPQHDVAVKIIQVLQEDPKDYPHWFMLHRLLSLASSERTPIPYLIANNQIIKIAEEMRDIIRTLPPSSQKSKLEKLNKTLQNLGENQWLAGVNKADIIKGLIT